MLNDTIRPKLIKKQQAKKSERLHRCCCRTRTMQLEGIQKKIKEKTLVFLIFATQLREIRSDNLNMVLFNVDTTAVEFVWFLEYIPLIKWAVKHTEHDTNNKESFCFLKFFVSFVFSCI